MKKIIVNYGSIKLSNQILLKMKLTILILFTSVLSSISAETYSQITKLNVVENNSTLLSVIRTIENQSEFNFFYNEKVNIDRMVTVDMTDKTVFEILDKVLTNSTVKYKVIGRQIALYDKNEMEPFLPEADQDRSISGKVTDNNGTALPGVNVVVTGSTIGTITDLNGIYSIEVPEGSTSLTFSFIGMEEQEIYIGTLTQINVTMAESAVGLGEVVVVGYGTERKADLTGSVVSISNKKIMNRQVGQTSMVLQGIAPGVTITQRNGEPGLDGGNIRIRGIGTLNNANPLVLVDGVEMSMNNIDPASIQSISVLKDASSSSIYGSKAANGVILITTKRGSEGSFTLSYNSYVGFQKPTNLPHKVNGLDHMTLLNEAYTNTGRTPLYSDAYIQEYITNKGSNPDKYPDTDWQKEVLTGNGFQTNNVLSLSGGDEKLKIFGEIGSMSQNGLLKSVNYKKYFARINTDVKISDKISGSFDLYVYNSNRNSVAEFPGDNPGAISAESSTGLIFGMMNKLPAVQAIKYSNGLYGEGQNGVNPVAILEDRGYYHEKSMPVMGNFSLNYKPFEFLTAKVSYSPSYSQPLVKSYVTTIKTYDMDGNLRFALPSPNYLNENVIKNRQDQFTSTLNFAKDFNQHSITALAGYQYENSSNEGFSAYRDGFLFPEYSVFSAGSSSNMKNDGWATESTLISYFGRINYDYAGKYLFQSNVRYDGSSRFAAGNKWGVFPSFSFGWRISEEQFMNSLKEDMNNLKIRASWGRLGNQNIGSNYPFASLVSLSQGYISNDEYQDGAAITALANTDISWETTEMANIGLDITFRKKLSASFDYYQKKTTGILLQLNIPGTMGATAPFQNAAVVQNIGWDFQLDYRNSFRKLEYSATLTFSDVKNKILDMSGIKQTGITVDNEGYAINSLYLYHSLGYITSSDMDATGKYTGAPQFGSVQPGDIKYEDYNKDGIINTEDKRVLGNTIPRYTFSLNLYLGYQNFDFSTLLQGVGKVDGYIRGNGNIPFSMGGTGYDYQTNRWTIEDPNPNAMFPRLAFGETNNTQFSDFWMKSAAYLRIKSLQLGYTIPKTVTSKLNIKSLRVYLSAENISTFDNFWPDADPEISPSSSGAYYPQVKTYNAGLNVIF